MSGVDVLAVMDRYGRIFDPNKGFDGVDMRAARTTVSDLIERERVLRNALQEIADHPRDISGAPEMVAIAANALARCGGAARPPTATSYPPCRQASRRLAHPTPYPPTRPSMNPSRACLRSLR